MPITLSFVSTIAIRSELSKKDNFGLRIHTSFTDKSSFTEQIIIGRKFSDAFSMQFMPIFIFNHNRLDSINTYTKNRETLIYGEKRKNTFALGIGGRLKVTKRISLNAEYYYQLPDSKPPTRYNNVSLGVDVETGGHVFQMHFTNSNGMTEKSFITDTDDKWKTGHIRFGFNISRVFTIGKHKS
jgi:opacity protein-like surface antigen